MCLLVGDTAVVRSLGIRICVWGTIEINSGIRGVGIEFAVRADSAFRSLCLRAVFLDAFYKTRFPRLCVDTDAHQREFVIQWVLSWNAGECDQPCVAHIWTVFNATLQVAGS